MSQMSVATTVAKRSTVGTTRTSLRVVTPEAKAGSPWFAVLCGALLLFGLAAVLGLNTAMAQDSFDVAALEAESAHLADTEDALAHAINARSAPQALASEARDLGMVPSSTAAFIDIDKGTILGVATVAEMPEGFTVDAGSTATVDEQSSSTPSESKADDQPASEKGSSEQGENKSTTGSDASKAKERNADRRGGEGADNRPAAAETQPKADKQTD